jgi:mannose-6-phosphate isomerase
MFSRKTGTSHPAARERPLFVEVAPFRIEPRFVTRIWGWLDLRPWYDRSAVGDPIGEVWLTGDDCLIGSGPQAGKTLGSMFEEEASALLGADKTHSGSPLLIKVIFAREKLSVQVHPDDRLAQKYGQPRGKTECWYALAAEPGAQVAVGLKAGATVEKVRAEIEAGTLEGSLNLLPVTQGDMFLVDAGTVHAIWPGSVLLETQQNSDLTYRMYDYGRGRELHIEKSLEAMRPEAPAGKVAAKVFPDRTILVDAPYFRVERIVVTTSRSSESLPAKDERKSVFSYLFAAAGSARLASPSFESIDIPARAIVGVPAASSVFSVEDLGGLDLFRITPRWPGQAE